MTNGTYGPGAFPNLSTAQALGVIMHNESGGQNVYNYLYNTNPSYYTASGYYQITNSTWAQGAALAGVDTSQYPTAISAPYSVQTQVASALYENYGAQPWSAAAGGSNATTQQLAALNSGQSIGYDPLAVGPQPAGGQLAANAGGQLGTAGTGGAWNEAGASGTTAGAGGANASGTTAGAGGGGYTVTPEGVPQQLPPGVATTPGSIGGLNITLGLGQSLWNWLTGTMGNVLGTAQNWLTRALVVIIGLVLVALALWRLMSDETKQAMFAAA